jgi:hypothetical protein
LAEWDGGLEVGLGLELADVADARALGRGGPDEGLGEGWEDDAGGFGAAVNEEDEREN